MKKKTADAQPIDTDLPLPLVLAPPDATSTDGEPMPDRERDRLRLAELEALAVAADPISTARGKYERTLVRRAELLGAAGADIDVAANELRTAIAEAQARIDSATEVARANLAAAGYVLDGAREEEQRSHDEWKRADAALADATDAHAAVRRRDELEVAHRKAVKARQLAEVARDGARVEHERCAAARVDHPSILTPRQDALALVAMFKDAQREAYELERRAFDVVADDPTSSPIVNVAIAAANYIAKKGFPRHAHNISHDSAFGVVRYVCDSLNLSRPSDVSQAHLDRYLHAAMVGQVSSLAKDDLHAVNEKSRAAAEQHQAYEAGLRTKSRIDGLNDRRRSIEETLRGPTLHNMTTGRPMKEPTQQLESELERVKAEIARLENGTPAQPEAPPAPARLEGFTSNIRTASAAH